MNYLRVVLCVLVVTFIWAGSDLFAWNQGNKTNSEVATEISDYLDNESRFDRRLRRKREYSQLQLDNPRVNPVTTGFFRDHMLYNKNEKCFPWGWTGGEYNRLAVDVDAELCLIAKMDRVVGIDSMESRVEVASGVTLHVTNNSYDVLSADLAAISRMQGSPTARANVRVMGNTIWSFNKTVPSKRWSKSFDGFTIDKKVPYYFNLGPIPVTVQLGILGSVSVDLSAELAINNLSATAEPDLESTLYAFGGIEFWIIKAGLNANMTLADDKFKLQGKFGVNVDPVNPGLVYVAQVTGENHLDALAGDVVFVAESEEPLPGVGTEFEYPLYSWKGFSQSVVVFDEKIGPARVRF